MTTGVIHSGICGYTITVKADSTNGQTVELAITSDCPNYQKIAAELKEVDAFQELFQKLHTGTVYQTFAKYSPHPSCPGLSGILKTVEVAAGLALPQTASIEVTKD
ncbi:MAG: hypothetical protein QMC95_04765 [Desulfitobacteriaceae bacterium]|nr:hypothetical protein [Desulfitobacteriaceae bacterium]MDI6878173.1 hypothetical protein [Desulfitobacteriaceae bacterium]MDI6913513.1 hypothetical protein [Desulfitobacteriaceae bacterium]